MNESERFIKDFESGSQPRWISLLGTSGNGKTMCGTHLWRRLSRRANWTGCDFFRETIYWPNLIDELRSTQSFEKYIELKRWPILFVDDIFAERDPNGFAVDKLNCLLGSRIGKWTIITANSTVSEIEKVDRRIASRLVRKPNVCVVNMAMDYAFRE